MMYNASYSVQGNCWNRSCSIPIPREKAREFAERLRALFDEYEDKNPPDPYPLPVSCLPSTAPNDSSPIDAGEQTQRKK